MGLVQKNWNWFLNCMGLVMGLDSDLELNLGPGLILDIVRYWDWYTIFGTVYLHITFETGQITILPMWFIFQY